MCATFKSYELFLLFFGKKATTLNCTSDLAMHFIIGGTNLPRPNFRPGTTVFLETLLSMGHSFAFEGNGDIFVNLDHSQECLSKWIEENGELKPRILIRLETKSVYPNQYTSRVENAYSQIYSIGTSEIKYKGKKLGYPYVPSKHNIIQEVQLDLEEVLEQHKRENIFSELHWNSRPNKAVFVGSNKFISDDYYYSIRRYFVSKELENGTLQVFGDFWVNSRVKRFIYLIRSTLYSFRVGERRNPLEKFSWVLRDYPEARGEIRDKLELLKQSKFNLIIENSPGFVTEKVFDAILCGAVPIYFGASFIDSPLLEKCILRVTEMQLLTSDLENIICSSENSIESKLKSMSTFLSSREFRDNWTAKGVFLGLIRDILEEFV